MGTNLRRWFGPILLLAVLAAGIGYWFFWNHLADNLKTGVDRWVSARQAEGMDVAHGAVTVTGFPYRLLVSIDAPRLSAPEHPLAPSWGAEQLLVYFQPWNFSHAILQPIGPQPLAWGPADARKATLIQSNDARVSARFDAAGQIDNIAADLRDVVADGDSPLRQASRIQFHMRSNSGQSDDRPANSTNIALTGNDMVLLPDATPLGESFDEAAVSLLFRPLPAGTEPDQLDRWRDQGGVIDVNRIAFLKDKLRVSGDGTVALDLARRPEGAMVFIVQDADQFIDALAAAGEMSDLTRIGLRMAVSALEKTDKEGNRTVTLPLAVQNGMVSLLKFNLFPVPPVY
ncbi:MAG: DUF2125 domain-containing protein [Minwuia sp.]|nr:DUF2125 domain-containing protein [Minwuia sp.]